MLKGKAGRKWRSGIFVLAMIAMVSAGCSKKAVPVVGSAGVGSGSGSSPSGSGSGSDSMSARNGQSGVGESSMSKNNGMGSDSSSGMNGKDGMASSGGSNSMSGSDSGMSHMGPKFSNDVYFDYDRWAIRTDAKDVLAKNAEWLVKNTQVKVKIEGHGDERGTNEYNLALGERRARSTKRFLMNMGIDAGRISFISYGEEKNVCSEKTEPCFQQNRRAHFIVKK